MLVKIHSALSCVNGMQNAVRCNIAVMMRIPIVMCRWPGRLATGCTDRKARAWRTFYCSMMMQMVWASSVAAPSVRLTSLSTHQSGHNACMNCALITAPPRQRVVAPLVEHSTLRLRNPRWGNQNPLLLSSRAWHS